VALDVLDSEVMGMGLGASGGVANRGGVPLGGVPPCGKLNADRGLF